SNGDASLFQRLSQHFKNVSWELRKFVEKQHAVVRHADFARTWNRAASNETCIRYRVVRRAKGSRVCQSAFGRKQAGDRMDARRFEAFLKTHRRKNRGNTFRQHRLAGPG